MYKTMIAAALIACPTLLAAQATNPESSGAPASAQQDPAVSGSAKSMPEGAATMQNQTSSGSAGITNNGNGRMSGSKSGKHHRHGAASAGSSSAPTTGAPE